jgi:hypothetical protein
MNQGISSETAQYPGFPSKEKPGKPLRDIHHGKVKLQDEITDVRSQISLEIFCAYSLGILIAASIP